MHWFHAFVCISIFALRCKKFYWEPTRLEVSLQLSAPLVWWVLMWYTRSDVIRKVIPHLAHVFEADGPRAEMAAGGGWAIRAGWIRFEPPSMLGKRCLFRLWDNCSFLFWNAEASRSFLSGENCTNAPRGFKFCDTNVVGPKSWLRLLCAVKMFESLSFALGRWFPIIGSVSPWINLGCSDVILPSSSMKLLFSCPRCPLQ